MTGYPGVGLRELGVLSESEHYLLFGASVRMDAQRPVDSLGGVRWTLAEVLGQVDQREGLGWSLVHLIQVTDPYFAPDLTMLHLHYGWNRHRPWWAWRYLEPDPDFSLLPARLSAPRIQQLLSLLGVLKHSRAEEWSR